MTTYQVHIQNRATLRVALHIVRAETLDAARNQVRQKYAGTGWVVMENAR